MKIFYAVVVNSKVVNVIEWDNTKPNRPQTNAGILVACASTVQVGDVLNASTGVFSRPQPVTTANVTVAAPTSISEVAAELAQVEKSVQVLMTQK